MHLSISLSIHPPTNPLHTPPHNNRVRLLPAVAFSEGGGPSSAELKRRKKEKQQQQVYHIHVFMYVSVFVCIYIFMYMSVFLCVT